MRGGLLLVLLVTVVGGCGETFGDDDEPPPPPTSAELSRLVADTRQPAYWLGPRFRGAAVSYVNVRGSRVHLTYGPWTCDTGCVPESGVSTGRRSVADDLSSADFGYPIDPKKCWTRVGKAVAALLGCDPGGYPQELLVFSGTNRILIDSLALPDDEIPARTVVRGLRPLNDFAAWPLPRPAPLSCDEFSHVDRRYRRHMPQPLRPSGDC